MDAEFGAELLAARTPVLDIGYFDLGPRDGTPVLLLRGWPDDAHRWAAVARRLAAGAFRVVVPYLRGCGPAAFRSAGTIRDGRGVAVAKDALDLMDALGIDRFAVAGHDWGARAGYHLAALCPGRITHLAALARAFQPGGEFVTPSFTQSRRLWYQWFMCTGGGAAAVRSDPRGFARVQWETWSPRGWFTESEFDAAAASFGNPDWVSVTLHAYRSRWRREASDPRYGGWEAALRRAGSLPTPTLVLVGDADGCDETSSTAGQERYFTGAYRRVALAGIGHFPAREAPGEVAAEVMALLGT